jgi:hypothetical protein
MDRKNEPSSKKQMLDRNNIVNEYFKLVGKGMFKEGYCTDGHGLHVISKFYIKSKYCHVTFFLDDLVWSFEVNRRPRRDVLSG